MTKGTKDTTGNTNVSESKLKPKERMEKAHLPKNIKITKNIDEQNDDPKIQIIEVEREVPIEDRIKQDMRAISDSYFLVQELNYMSYRAWWDLVANMTMLMNPFSHKKD